MLTYMTRFFSKGQLNSERIYEVIVSPKMPTKINRDFCPGSVLEGKAEISVFLGETMTSLIHAEFNSPSLHHP